MNIGKHCHNVAITKFFVKYVVLLCLLYTNITFCKDISVHVGGISVNSEGISVNQGYFGNSMYRRKRAYNISTYTMTAARIRWVRISYICFLYTIYFFVVLLINMSYGATVRANAANSFYPCLE